MIHGIGLHNWFPVPWNYPIFDFVVVHNWKIPRGLTETHEVDLDLRINWRREVDNENDEIFSPCSLSLSIERSIDPFQEMNA